MLTTPLSRMTNNSSNEIWQSAIRLLEQSVYPDQMKLWIQPLEVGDSNHEGARMHLTLWAPNDFTTQWVRDQYRKKIEAAISQVLGTPCEIVLKTREDQAANPIASPAYLPEIDPAAEILAQPAHQLPDPLTSPEFIATQTQRAYNCTPIDQRYTFDNFVVGASNQFAHAAALSVANQPGKQYNPLFIYSPPGLGKTHLLHAIANALLLKNPNIRIAYLSAESFMNEVVISIQRQKMHEFKAKYRDGFDIILMDDIQAIAGKQKTEEEFFHTFNALYHTNRQLVLTSDRPPKEIVGLEERTRTRFESGLIADIQPPEIETRIAILKNKAEQDDLYLPDDVCTFLANHIKSNVRELHGVLVKLQLQSSLTGAEISLEMAKQLFKHMIPEETSQVTVESIQAAVAKFYQLRLQDLKASNRTAKVALARQVAMYLVKKYTGIKPAEIGTYFGGRDRTTVMYAIKKIEDDLVVDAQLKEALEAIQNLL